MVRKKIKKQRRKNKNKSKLPIDHKKFDTIVAKLINMDYPDMNKNTLTSLITRTTDLLHESYDISNYQSMVNKALMQLCNESISENKTGVDDVIEQFSVCSIKSLNSI
tara:strand:- start:2304 stop:2627 length:324 start_codon:yes stop_codon:yes gene_type:complete